MRRGLVEVLLIVGSILLAFAIDAAWDARRDRLAEEELLATLREEFRENRSVMVRHRDRWETVRVDTERLIDLQARGVSSEPAVMDTLLFRFLTPTTFDPNDGALAGATAAGALGLVRDPELRSMLAAWPGRVAEVRDNEEAMRTFLLGVVTPFLSEREIPLARSRALLVEGGDDSAGAQGVPSDRWPAPLPGDADARRAYDRLLRDPAFEPLLVTRYGWINVDEYDEAIAFLDGLLRRLDGALP